MFGLCSECIKSHNSKNCNHSNKQRALVGTWISVKLQKAVTLGYKILKIYEILHYSQTSQNIFQNYIKPWYKIKTEASPWPKSCVTEEDKQNFIAQFETRRNKIRL